MVRRLQIHSSILDNLNLLISVQVFFSSDPTLQYCANAVLVFTKLRIRLRLLQKINIVCLCFNWKAIVTRHAKQEGMSCLAYVIHLGHLSRLEGGAGLGLTSTLGNLVPHVQKRRDQHHW